MQESQSEIDLQALFARIDINAVASEQVAIDLQTLDKARSYRRWLYSQIQGGLGKRILEIGSGVGNYTHFLLEHGEVWATDMEDVYLDVLRDRFGSNPNFTASLLTLGPWSAEIRQQVRHFNPDTIVCMNVLEHVEQDAESVREMFEGLDIGGHILLIVPALPGLYCNLDERYGHFRRYTRQDVPRLVSGLKGAKVVREEYFNMLGTVGWWFNHVLLHRGQLPARQTQTFDRLVPGLGWLEQRIRPPFGLSLSIWIRRES